MSSEDFIGVTIVGVCKFNSFSGLQLWKLDGNKLQNKGGLWMSDEEWNFKTFKKGVETDLIHIENISRNKVLENSYFDGVVLQGYIQDSIFQQWEKGESDDEGYFTLENDGNPNKLLTATLSRPNYSLGLAIRGNIL